MYDLDAMLSGKLSRQRYQAMIQQTRQERFAREVEAAQSRGKTPPSMYAVLIALINLVIG